MPGARKKDPGDDWDEQSQNYIERFIRRALIQQRV
jgi:hypothetical protein